MKKTSLKDRGVNLFLFLYLIFLLPLLFLMFFFNILTFSFTRLGVGPAGVLFLLLGSLLGSVINIPVSRRQVPVSEPEDSRPPFFFYYPPPVKTQTIYVNLGGAVIPTIFSLYLLFTGAPLWPTITATAVVTLICKLLARPVRGVGIALPSLIPPLVAALAAIIFTGRGAAPVAYIAGTLGTLIGADLLNLSSIQRLGSQALSIGGAGVFDGIFLAGLLAVILS